MKSFILKVSMPSFLQTLKGFKSETAVFSASAEAEA